MTGTDSGREREGKFGWSKAPWNQPIRRLDLPAHVLSKGSSVDRDLSKTSHLSMGTLFPLARSVMA